MSILKLFISCIFIVSLLSALNTSQVENPLKKNSLDDKELMYIKNHPIIKVHCVSDSAPYNFVKDGEGYGYSIDHIRLVASKVGLKLDVVVGYTWNEYLELLKNGQIDVMLNIVKNKDREKYFAFTSAYLSVVNTVFAKSHNEYNRLSDLNGKTLSMVKGFSEKELIERLYPEIDILFVENDLEALKAVSLSKADATIQNIGIANGLVSKYGITNIIPAFEIKDENFQIHVHLATNKNNEILRDILEKGKNVINKKEMKTLSDKWLVEKRLYDKYKLNFELIKYLLIIAFVIIGLIIYRYIILKKAKSEIEEQSKNLRDAQGELKLLASTDSMTKLFNRRYFIEASELILELAKRKKTDLSIIMIDIDNFKNINDTKGHKVGDDVIIALANILQKYSRKSDIISRWGGEEFLILLPDTDLEGALVIAEKFRKETEALLMNSDDNKVFTFTISAGISIIDDDSDLNSAIKRADKALYISKENGKNKVSIYTSYRG